MQDQSKAPTDEEVMKALEEEVAEVNWEDQPIDPKMIEDFDATLGDHLPKEFELDIFASELLMYLTEYHKARLATRIARSNGDNARATELWKTAVHCRNCAALIQSQFGKPVIDLKDTLAKFRAKQAATQRKALVED